MIQKRADVKRAEERSYVDMEVTIATKLEPLMQRGVEFCEVGRCRLKRVETGVEDSVETSVETTGETTGETSGESAWLQRVKL